MPCVSAFKSQSRNTINLLGSSPDTSVLIEALLCGAGQSVLLH